MHTSRKKFELRRVAAVLATLAICVALAVVGTATASAAAPKSGSASKGPPQGMCPITATADATLYDDGLNSEGRLHTAADIGPNEYLFVGCRYHITVDLYGVTPWTGAEGIMTSFQHQAVAGSRWDPWGNHKWPSWDDTFNVNYAKALTRVVVTLDPVTN
jgi:hypothetical protein